MGVDNTLFSKTPTSTFPQIYDIIVCEKFSGAPGKMSILTSPN